MPVPKNGHEIPCAGGCGKLVYVKGSYITRKIRKTCGAPECRSAIMSGANNPFWGKHHDDETREKIKEGRRRSRPRRCGPEKGSFKHSAETRAKMSEALRQRWIDKRQMMLDSRSRGENHHMKGLHPEPRYRKNFSPLMRREWTDDKCFWCGSTEKLTLDHILPVMCGGENTKDNAQTLCHPCNLWKMVYVDRPLMKALGGKGGRI